MTTDPQAAQVVRVIVSDTEAHEVQLQPFDRLTVADYVRITEPVEGEQPHELVARVFGLPERITWVMTAHEVNSLVEWYLKWMREGAKNWGNVKAVSEALSIAENEGRTWTIPEARAMLERHGFDAERIVVDGVPYVVPQRLDHDTLWGQWLSLKHVADRHKGPEAALYPKVLAILCMREGERYPTRGADETREGFEARFGEWTTQRRAVFQRARIVDALGACAFFLSSSAQFRGTMRHSMTSFPRLKVPSSAQAPKNTPSAGAPSAYSGPA